MKKEFACIKKYSTMCHASTVLPLPNESVLVAWFGGEKEGETDVAIWVAKKTAKGFEEAKKISDSNEPHWNPVLFQWDKETIILFYKVGRSIKDWVTKYRISKDGGNTFSDSYQFIENGDLGGGPVRNKPIRLSSGTILLPNSTEDGIWKASVYYCNGEINDVKKGNEVSIEGLVYDGEKTSETSDIEVSQQSFFGRGVIQPTLWERENGEVSMLLRSSEGRIYRSDSINQGIYFSEAYETEMPNNNSGIDLVKLESGVILLVYNPVEDNWGKRTPLSIAMSRDDGKNFKKILDIEDKEGEYSYPAIVADEDYLYVTYTYNRENICLLTISKKEIENWGFEHE